MPACRTARAVDIDGVQLPATVQAGGTTLQLNGYGLRTFSILAVHIYVAALYLERPNTNANAILQSPQTKLLTVRFEHDVDADAARNAWRTALAKNCLAPCQLDADDEEKFLSLVPAMHAGDNYDILFTQQGAIVSVNGQQVGVVPKVQFANAMLATFLGPNPASPLLKRALLGLHR